MRKNHLSVLFAMAILFTVLFAVRAAGDDNKVTFLTYQVNPKAVLSSGFAKQLSAMPEWESFYETFCSACSGDLTKEKNKIQQSLPPGIANDITDFIESDRPVQKFIKALFGHIESVVFEFRAKPDDVADLLQGRKNDFDADFDGLLAFVIGKNPRDWLPILNYSLRRGKDYKFLQNEPDGDFIVEFDIEMGNKNIKFCCAGVKIKDNRFALIFSDDDSIRKCSRMFKSGQFPKGDISQPREELVLEAPCFQMLHRHLQQANVVIKAADFFSKIKRAESLFSDINGISQWKVSVEMQTADDAKTLRDFLAGVSAFAQMNLEDNSPESNVIKLISITADGNSVSAVIKTDNPDLWKLIGKGLNKAEKEINKRK